MTDENFTVAEVGEEEVSSTFVGAARLISKGKLIESY
jgi:hypothetical protein